MLVKAFPSTLMGLSGLSGMGDDTTIDTTAGTLVIPSGVDPSLPVLQTSSDPSISPITSQVSGPAASTSSGFNWGGFLSQLVGTGANVATKAIQAGNTVITYPNGSSVVVPPGQQVPSMPSTLGISSSGLFGQSSSSGLLIVGVAAVVLVMLMNKGGR